VDTLNFAYDLMGRLITASNDAGLYEFEYDALGRITRVEEPFGVWLEFEYDPQGNRTVVTDSFGGTTTSTYNAAQQLLSRPGAVLSCGVHGAPVTWGGANMQVI
jgi:YD repeat-containing protein